MPLIVLAAARCIGSTPRRRCSRTTRSSATSRATCTTRTSQLGDAAAVVAARAARVGASRSSRWSRRASMCRAFASTREPRPAGRRDRTAASWRSRWSPARLTLHLHGGDARLSRSTPRRSRTSSAARIETAHFVIHYAKTPEIERDIALVAARSRVSLCAGRRAARRRAAGQAALVLLRESRSEGALDRREGRRDGQAVAARDLSRASARSRTARCATRSRTRSRAQFGDPIFGVAAQRDRRRAACWSAPGLIEGLAVAVDWPARLRPTDAARSRARDAGDGHDAVDPRAAVAAVPHRVVGAQLHDRRLVHAVSCSTRTARQRCARCIGSGGDFERAYGKSIGDARGRVAHDDQHDRAARRGDRGHARTVSRRQRVRAALPARECGAHASAPSSAYARGDRAAGDRAAARRLRGCARGAALPARARRFPRRWRCRASASKRSRCGPRSPKRDT